MKRPPWLEIRDFVLSLSNMTVCIWLYALNGSWLFLVAATTSGLAVALGVALVLFRLCVDSRPDEVEAEATVTDLDEQRRRHSA